MVELYANNSAAALAFPNLKMRSPACVAGAWYFDKVAAKASTQSALKVLDLSIRHIHPFFKGDRDSVRVGNPSGARSRKVYRGVITQNVILQLIHASFKLQMMLRVARSPTM